ncbi:putative isomerase YddE [Symmachiella macrocystis]|uniref:Putative isomerase YddE n=1 Tax=Symmachiella macrocystis TaxID=2527985 RepID=A0A5C6BBC5_9PLAN|nr:putative isomerase YddE [Symmachiella macrocystis]
MSQEIIIVDAFTDQPFAGNPAAVCVLPEPRDAEWMQRVASEMNLSETAYAYREEDAFRLRWFTPTMEVDLCGHATLATAHVLWSEGHLANDVPALFNTNSGRLTASRDGEWINLNFPAEPPVDTETPSVLAAALGATPIYVGKNRMDLLAEIDSEETLRALIPDLQLISEIPTRGVIVTCR